MESKAGEEPACEQGILYVWNQKAGEEPACEQGYKLSGFNDH